MTVKTVAQLNTADFDLKNITVTAVSFSEGDTSDYLECARTKHLFHLITHGSREYFLDSRHLTFPEGTALFIPEGTRYRTVSHVAPDDSCRGIGICFDMTDANGNNLRLSPDVYSAWSRAVPRLSERFCEAEHFCHSIPISLLELKIRIFELLRELSISENQPFNHARISPALRFIEAHFSENLPVRVYAEQCRLSESYFRRLFSETMGISPLDYRNLLRFHEAKKLYRQNFSLQKIAEHTGFSDAGRFSKAYKQATGSTFKKDFETV